MVLKKMLKSCWKALEVIDLESHKRSIAKTITWRIIATFITTIITFWFTGNTALSIAIGFTDTLIKLFTYYFHERIWNKINFGRKLDV